MFMFPVFRNFQTYNICIESFITAVPRFNKIQVPIISLNARNDNNEDSTEPLMFNNI
jgi:hypothetical protein